MHFSHLYEQQSQKHTHTYANDIDYYYFYYSKKVRSFLVKACGTQNRGAVK